MTRALLASVCAMSATLSASALDEIVLKNGRRYLGNIVSNTSTSIVLAIDGGTVEFPRSIVASPPYFGPDSPAESGTTAAEAAPTGPEIETEQVEVHPLPSVADSLQALSRFPWVKEIRQVPVLVADQGRWQFLPCVSFWAADFFQLSFYGDPARPSAVEVSLHHPPANAWEQKQRLLEYVLSLSPALAVDNRFDRLDVHGDQFTIGDVWLELTAPESEKTPGRWAILLLHELSLKDARATYDDLQVISEPVQAAMIDPTQPRSWQRGTWLPDELAWVRQAPGTGNLEAPTARNTDRGVIFTPLEGERVYVRAFERTRGKYARTSIDWTRGFAAAAP